MRGLRATALTHFLIALGIFIVLTLAAAVTFWTAQQWMSQTLTTIGCVVAGAINVLLCQMIYDHLRARAWQKRADLEDAQRISARRLSQAIEDDRTLERQLMEKRGKRFDQIPPEERRPPGEFRTKR